MDTKNGHPQVSIQQGPLEGISADAAARQKLSFKEQILKATPPQPEQMLTAYLRRRIAFISNRNSDQIGEDYDVRELAFKLGQEWLFLSQIILKDFGLRLFPNELLKISSINALALYILDELRGGSTTALPDTHKSHPEESDYWPWDDPRLLPKPVERNPPVVFILSAPRSGSTLLQVMLGGHPSLFSPPELFLLPFASMAQRRNAFHRLGYNHMELSLLHTLMELKGLDWSKSEKLILDLIEQDMSIQRVYRLLQDTAYPRVLVDKTPAYAASVDWLKRAEDLFEGAKYIHLFRHPYAFIESFLRMRFDKLCGKNFGVWDRNPTRFAEKLWASFNDDILKFFETVETERRLQVCYEDLVSKPEPVVRRLCNFLGLPLDDMILKPYEHKRLRQAATGQVSHFGDANFFNHNVIDASLAEAWKQVRLPFQLETATRNIAAELNYELRG